MEVLSEDWEESARWYKIYEENKGILFRKKRDIVLYQGGIALCMTSNFGICKNVGTVVCRCTAAANRID